MKGLGITVSAVTVLAVRPTPEVERALQTPELERVQAGRRQGDLRAAIGRGRAGAGDRRERAPEPHRALAPRGVARRQERLNDRKRAEAGAEAQAIAARGESARIAELSGARVAAERERIAVYRDTPVPLLQALALRDLARNLPAIEHLAITPELLTPFLARLAEGARR